MTCHEARELFSADLDDALTAGERSAVEAHVAGCPECRREQARFRATVAALRAVEPARAPVGFVDRVMAAARPVPWHERLRRRLLSPVALRRPIEVTVVALVGLTAVYLYERTPELHQAAGPASVRPMSEPVAREKAPAAGATAPSTESRPRLPAPPAEVAKKELADQSRDAFRQAEKPPAAVPPVASPSPSRAPKPDAVAPSAQSERKLGEEGRYREQAESQRAYATPPSSTTGAAPPAAATAPPAASGPKTDAVAPSKAQESENKAAAVEQRVDAKRREAAGLAKSAAPAAPPALAGRLAAAPDVVGTLAVSDRNAARQAVSALLARVGGRELPRPPDAPADIVEILLPGAAYPELVAGLAGVGRWEPSRPPADLPAQLRVRLVLTD